MPNPFVRANARLHGPPRERISSDRAESEQSGGQVQGDG